MLGISGLQEPFSITHRGIHLKLSSILQLRTCSLECISYTATGTSSSLWQCRSSLSQAPAATGTSAEARVEPCAVLFCTHTAPALVLTLSRKSFWRGIILHGGSLAFGSAVLAVVALIKLFMDYIHVLSLQRPQLTHLVRSV